MTVQDSTTLLDGVLVRLRAMIADGELAAGAPVREREMCELLSVSRTPLREALKVLAAERLLELRPNRGAIVLGLTERDVRDMFEVMEALEATAGRLACERASDADIAEIQALHWQMHAHYLRAELEPYFRLNQAIHARIVDATGNAVLQSNYAALAARIRNARYLANRWSRERWDEAMREHGLILDALIARDGARLSEILAGHLRGKGAAVLEHLQAPIPAEAGTRSAAAA
ncbi:MAG: putative transcriptional regulatory protein GntR family [Rhodospirillales bacterium]|jgi:DNA-binding GntR family transcriptional regulator|nr:putative transcriptional regulatory protein GntR family [Rhodospirillales bacterium]